MPKPYNTTAIKRPRALLLFTNRAKQRDLLQQFFSSIQSAEPIERPIMHFYGVGGVGKTTLYAKAIQEWHDANPKSRLRIANLSVDSDAWNQNSQVSSFFVHLRAAIKEVGVRAPLFDALHFCLWAKQNPREKCTLNNSPFSDFLSEKLPYGDIISAVSDHVGGFFASFNPVTVLDKIWGKLLEVDGFQSLVSAFEKKPAEMSEKELTNHMPEALAADLRRFLAVNPKDSLCMSIDGFERVQSKSTSRFDIQERFQDLVGRLVLPRTQRLGFIVLGREKLRWEVFDEETTPSDMRWPTFINSHLLGGLTRSDAESFLDSARRQIDHPGVRSILSDHKEAILTASGDGVPDSPCYPYYLDLALDLVCRHADKFDPEMLGRKSDELEERFLRYLDPGERKTLQALALAGNFDKRLFQDLVERRVIQAYAKTDFSYITGPLDDEDKGPSRSYLNEVPREPGWYCFHRHMGGALVKSLARGEDKETALAILEEIMESLENRFEINDPIEILREHFAPYSHAFRILTTHALETGLLQPKFVANRFVKWTSPVYPIYCGFASERAALVSPLVAYFEKFLGLEHAVTLNSLSYLACLLLNQRDLDGAENLCLRAMDAQERTLGQEHPHFLNSVIVMAMLRCRKDDLNGAGIQYDRALAIWDSIRDQADPETHTRLDHLSMMLYSKHNPDGPLGL